MALKRLRWLLALTSVATIAVSIVACRGTRTRTVVHDFHLALTFRPPATGRYTTVSGATDGVCAGTNSWLMSFDTSGAGRFDRRFLFGTAGNLVGCGGGVKPCANDRVAMTFSTDDRVMLEGLSVAPGAYLTASSVDVVCRGVADGRLDSSSLVATNGTTLAVRFDLLRIGAFNGMMTAAGPIVRHAAATLEEPRPVASRTTSGGIVVVGGGDDGSGPSSGTVQDGIWEFHPWTLSFTQTGTLTPARNYLTATAFWYGGEPAVMFAGGQTGANPSNAVDYYAPNGGPTIPSSLGTLLTSRGAHSAVYLPAVGTTGQGILFVGGCNADPAAFNSTNSLQGATEMFLPGATTSSHHHAGSAATFLVDDNQVTSLCKNAAGRLGSSRVWFGTGYATTGSALVFDDATTEWMLDYTNGIPPGPPNPKKSPIVGGPRRSAAVAQIGTSAIAAFGGCADIGGNFVDGLSDWLLTTTGTSSVLGLTSMQYKRNGGRAEQLLDGRVLISGGVDGAYGTGTPTTDILEPASIPSPFGSDWVFRAANGLPVMAVSRYSHEMTRVEGTTSWVNGSLLVVGFSNDAGATAWPELYVPAYDCGGGAAQDEPIRVTDGVSLRQLGLVDACDRGRKPQPLSDPLKP